MMFPGKEVLIRYMPDGFHYDESLLEQVNG
jgi:hypothetical protein